MEFLRNWIISIVVTVIFMVVVDLILPSNSIRKYAKFVTGLIVIVTILSPIFKLFDRSSSIETYINQYVSTYDTNTKGMDRKDIEKRIQDQTMDVFRNKLKEKIQQEIHSETGKNYLVTKLEVVEDVNSLDFGSIRYIELKSSLSDREIKPVDKVVIDKNTKSVEEIKDQKVLNYLKDRFAVNPTMVKFVK